MIILSNYAIKLTTNMYFKYYVAEIVRTQTVKFTTPLIWNELKSAIIFPCNWI